VAAFRQVYADPVLINGVDMTAAELVARALHAALNERTFEIIERFGADSRLAVVHRQSGRHVGPLPTPLGDLRPTGHMVEALTIFKGSPDQMMQCYYDAQQVLRNNSVPPPGRGALTNWLRPGRLPGSTPRG
jgi:hypothetical protein